MNGKDLYTAMDKIDDKLIVDSAVAQTCTTKKSKGKLIGLITGGAALVTAAALMIAILPTLSKSDGMFVGDALADVNGSSVYKIDEDYFEQNSVSSIESEMALEWRATSYSYMTHDSKNLLVFEGKRVSSEKYGYEINSGDMKSRVCFTISKIKINNILKENNTSGYKNGDTVSVIEQHTYIFDNDAQKWYMIVRESGSEPFVTDDESVYLISRNSEKTYIPEAIRNTGLTDGDIWDVTGISTTEFFSQIWSEVESNIEDYERNFGD